MRIAVAGAGIAGLTAAIALARRGFSVEIFERAAELEDVGAGIQLSPNAMAVLEGLGVIDDLASVLVEPRAIEIRAAWGGALLARIPLGETARRRWGAPYCLAHRADLRAGLAAVARRDPRIALVLHADIHDVRGTESGVVFSAGGRARLADVLIAADGVRSRIRADCFGHAGPTPLGSTAWRATLSASDAPEPASRDITGLWLAPDAHLVHYPVRGGASLNLVMIGQGEPSPTPPAHRFGRPIRRLVDAVPKWTPWPLLVVDPRPAWTSGRVVLIGDAAHAMAPTAAQGGAQAIEDASTLANSLAADPGEPAQGLLAYERARRPRVERIVRAAKRNLALYELRGFPAIARDIALKNLPAEFLLARLDWIYGRRPE